MSVWNDAEYTKASGSVRSQFLKLVDLKTGGRVLKFLSREHQHQSEKTSDSAKSPDGMEWSYFFMDMTEGEGYERKHSPFAGKANSALTIEMKNKDIEPGDVILASAEGEGAGTRVTVVKLTTPQAVEEAQLKIKSGAVEGKDSSTIPF